MRERKKKNEIIPTIALNFHLETLSEIKERGTQAENDNIVWLRRHRLRGSGSMKQLKICEAANWRGGGWDGEKGNLYL